MIFTHEQTDQTRRDIEIYEYFLKPGYLVANTDDTIVRTVVGNCVAVTIFDRHQRFGGINHFIYPATRERRKATPQYGNVAIPALFKLLLNLGANRGHLEAQIFGGAYNRDLDDENLGEKNLAQARRMLIDLRVPVVSEDVGGSRGRKIVYHTGTNETAVIKVDRIRDNDWYLPSPDPFFAAGR